MEDNTPPAPEQTAAQGTITADENTITFGTLTVDITKVSEKEAARLWDILIRASKTNNRTPASKEMIDFIADTIATQNPGSSRETWINTILYNNLTDSLAFIGCIVAGICQKYDLKHYLTQYEQTHPETED